MTTELSEDSFSAFPMIFFLAITCLFSTFLSFSCQEPCGDIWDRSPSQLLDENEYVAMAIFDGVDTLVVLDSYQYMSSESDFMIVEYSFSIIRMFRGSERLVRIYLWNCERSRPSFSTMLGFIVGDTVLVNGNGISPNKELILIMSPNSPVNDLMRILHGKAPEFDWNTREVDSTLAEAINSSNLLWKHLEKRTSQREIVLYCPETFCLTMKDFYDGRLCFYDSSGNGYKVTSSEYTRILEQKTKEGTKTDD